MNNESPEDNKKCNICQEVPDYLICLNCDHLVCLVCSLKKILEQEDLEKIDFSKI